MERYPELLYQTACDQYESLPVEFALRKPNDDTAAYLISQMQYDRYVNTCIVILYAWQIIAIWLVERSAIISTNALPVNVSNFVIG